jgi:hypothetical protein
MLYVVSTKGDWEDLDVRRLLYAVVGRLAFDYKPAVVGPNFIGMKVCDDLAYVVLNIGLAAERLMFDPDDVVFMVEHDKDEYIQIDVCTAAKTIYHAFDIDLDNVLDMCEEKGYE